MYRPKTAFRYALIYVCGALLLLPARLLVAQQTPVITPLCRVAEEAKQIVEHTRGVKFQGEIACMVKTRAEIGAYIQERIKQELAPDKLFYEGLALKILGMFAWEYDYQADVHAIYESALGGYYDPETNSFSMADWTSPSAQRSVAVHELVHALQDERVDLERFVNFKALSADEAMARMALVEGEATLVTLDAEDPKARELSLPQRAQALLSSRTIPFAATFSPDYPDALQQLVQFPYQAGLAFSLHAAAHDGYAAIDHAFAYPPRSTEEILHREKRSDKAPDFEIPPLPALPSKQQLLYSDTIGEFTIRVLLRALGVRDEVAITSAAGWGGDALRLVRDTQHDLVRLHWHTNWDSLEDAAEFMAVFSRAQNVRAGREVSVIGTWDRVTPQVKLRILGKPRVAKRIPVVIEAEIPARFIFTKSPEEFSEARHSRS